MADSDTLDALKIAFTYMPQPIEVNRFTHGDDAERILEHITFVRETLLSLGIDPDEVAGEINPHATPNSCY